MKKLPNIMTFLLILAAVHVVHARWSHYHGTLLEVTRVRLCEELKEDMREHFMEDPGMRNVSIRVDLEFLNVEIGRASCRERV